MSPTPTLFLSHGSPMHALQAGRAGELWQRTGRTLPRPRAIVIASAHWETSVPMLTGSSMPETIHDFGGFPPELYDLRYNVHGEPELAAAVVDRLKEEGIAAGVDGCRGLDHGAWVPLRWMYPDASIPVVQLSLQPSLGAAHHLRLGRALAPLTNDGVLVIGSGHATHNLRDWMSQSRRSEPLRYVVAFSAWLDQRLAANDVDALLDWHEQAPEASRAHPSDEHLLPLFVAFGAAGERFSTTRILDGVENGALAMNSYRFDASA